MSAALWFLAGTATTIGALQITSRLLLRQANRIEDIE